MGQGISCVTIYVSINLRTKPHSQHMSQFVPEFACVSTNNARFACVPIVNKQKDGLPNQQTIGFACVLVTERQLNLLGSYPSNFWCGPVSGPVCGGFM